MPERRKGEVTLVAIMRGEGPYVGEWIRHYRGIGTHRIVVYDNGSWDPMTSVLWAAQLAYANVERRRWPNKPDIAPQRSAYLDALERCETEWIAFFDGDEFLNLRQFGSFAEFLASLPDECGAVGINWLMFGSGGARTRQPGGVRERFVRCAPYEAGTNRRFKTLARVDRVATMFVHQCELSEGIYTDSMGRSIEPMEHPTRTVCTDGPMLHHYITKSWEEFEKRTRKPVASARVGSPGRQQEAPEPRFARTDRNEIEDTSLREHARAERETPEDRAFARWTRVLTLGRGAG